MYEYDNSLYFNDFKMRSDREHNSLYISLDEMTGNLKTYYANVIAQTLIYNKITREQNKEYYRQDNTYDFSMLFSLFAGETVWPKQLFHVNPNDANDPRPIEYRLSEFDFGNMVVRDVPDYMEVLRFITINKVYYKNLCLDSDGDILDLYFDKGHIQVMAKINMEEVSESIMF